MDVFYRAEERTDRRAAITATLVANLHRKRARPPYKLQDFMVHRPPRRRRQTVTEQIAKVTALAAFLRQGPQRRPMDEES